jgi:hypothetical protein
MFKRKHSFKSRFLIGQGEMTMLIRDITLLRVKDHGLSHSTIQYSTLTQFGYFDYRIVDHFRYVNKRGYVLFLYMIIFILHSLLILDENQWALFVEIGQ